MTVATLMVQPKIQFLDNSGEPLSGGLVYTYQAGTLLPKTSYQSATMQAVNTNPVVLDSSGRANIWLDTSSTYYQIKVTDSLGNLIEMVDNVTGVGSSGVISTPAFPWVDVSSYSGLAGAVTSIGSSNVTLTVTNIQPVSTSLVIPANISLKVYNSGSITISAGQTLTINGPFDAGLYQVFSGSGNIVIFGSGSITEYQPVWFGNTTTPPSANTFPANVHCRRSTLTVGQPKGWFCTVAGQPGTWTSEGNL